jgi:hypothetical protein
MKYIITFEQYEAALLICKAYKKQINEEVDSIAIIDKLLIDMIDTGDISQRFFNIVCKNLDYFNSNLKGINSRLYKLSDLLKLSNRDILKLRNSGKENVRIFERLKEKYQQ